MNQKVITKILAIIILTTIVFANISIIGEYVYATNENLESQSTITNNSSVNFDAYFKDENGNKIHTIKASMNEDLNLYLYGKVAEGYLKDIQVTINNANFEIDEEKVIYGDIENISGNKITLNRIRRDEELEVKIPVKAIKTDEISLDMFNKENEISMNALLVKNNSRTKKISKKINTRVEWDNSVETTISQDVIKYIPFEQENKKGIILQTVIKTGLKNNTLPIENTQINSKVPTINGKMPKKVYVTANSTLATNGDNGLNFNESNWNLIEDTINIKVENKENNNKIIWKKECQDEYVLTFIYDEEVFETIKTSNAQIKLEVNAKIKAYNKNEIITKQDILKKELETKINDIVMIDLKLHNMINKGYMYTGFETQYKENLSIDIASEEITNSIILKENESTFINEETELKTNSIYKTTKINKLNFDKILGKDGYIKIYDPNNNLIETINNNSQLDNENNYVVTYNIELKELKFETSNIKTIGKLIIENTKTIPAKAGYTISQIKSFKQIKTNIDEILINNNIETVKSTKTYKENLEEPTTQIETTISNKNLSTLVENENIDIVVVLKNSDIKCNLYKNPIIKIQLPEYIETIKFNDNTKMFFTDELNIVKSEYDEKTKTITIELEGNQTKYNDITVTEGTTLTLNANIKLKEDTKEMQDKIITTVVNQEETVKTETVLNYIIPNLDDEEVVENTNNEETVNKEENTKPQENVVSQENTTPNNNTTQVDNNIENKENINVAESKKQIADIQVLLQSDLKDNSKVREGQVINYTATIVNMGKTTLNNIILEANIPECTTYREFVSGGNYSYDEYITDNRTVCTKTIKTLKPGEKAVLEYQIIVNENKNNIEKISAYAVAKIDGYENTTSEKIESTIKSGMLNIDLITKAHSKEKYTVGSEITYIGYIQNIKSVDATNVKAMCKLPDGISLKNAYFAVKLENDGKKVGYNKDTNTVLWSIDKLEANSRAEIQLVGIVNENANEIKNQFSVTCTDGEKISSNEITRYVDKANLSISQYTNIQDTYINVGDTLQYYISIKNDGTKTAEDVKIINTLPDGLEKVTLKYKNGNEQGKEVECQNKEITLSGFEILSGETLNIIITAKVSELPDGSKGTITYTNKARVSADGINEIEANEITHKLKVRNQSNNENKTYSISGIAWEDTSRDGKRDDNETLLKDIEVRLITKDQKTVAKTKTDKKGQYEFKNINNGEYLVLFIYDTTKYGITTYQAKNVVDSKNSDAAIEKEDFIDGNKENFAVTDVLKIEDSSIYNVDIGLVYTPKFDLSLTKTISKVTVKNSSEMKSYEYKNKTLAKVEIASKDVNDTTVIIEYTMTVKNEGNIAGYVKSIVDYLPNDLKFSSELNKDWFVGMNGNIYNESLANTIIQPGESKTIKLVVTKQMNEDNLGTINNSAEIAESYNDYGIEDIDSKAGNQSSKEDDYGTADMVISLNTGTIIMYTGLGITVLALIVVTVYMIKKKVLL